MVFHLVTLAGASIMISLKEIKKFTLRKLLGGAKDEAYP